MPDANSVSFSSGDGIHPIARAIRLPLAILLDTETLLAAGVGDALPPAEAEASFAAADRCAAGGWRCFGWQNQGRDGDFAFVALLRAEQAAHLHAAPLTVTEAGGADVTTLPGIDRLELDVEPLLAWLDAHGGEPGRIFDFVSERLAATGGPRCRLFLVELLSAISEQDGVIEVIAEPEAGGVLLEGWAMHLPATTLPVILLPGVPAAEEAAVAHVPRSGLLPSANGFVAYVRGTPGQSLADVGQLFFRSADRHFRLDVADNRLRREPDQVVGHLQEMMGHLKGSRESLRALNRVCRPRFPGHETVSTLDVPVRFACDVAVAVPGAGLFLSGWILDPKRLIKRVHVRSTAGFDSRIEETFVRTARPDVSDGFRHDALFAECLKPWDTLHGFTAFVRRREQAADGEVHYLEVVLEDESCVFLPIPIHDGDRDVVLQQILGRVDLDDPEIDRLIAAHLSPLVSGLTATAARPREPLSVSPFGPAAAEGWRPEVSVVVPLGDDWADFDVNLAGFAADPDFAAAELVVVAPRQAAASVVSRLRRATHFYRLRGRLVLSATYCDRGDALKLGAAVAAGERLVLLSPTVLPISRGWLGRLLAEFAALPPHAALCPTLLYEDHSIRYAGSDGPGAAGARVDATAADGSLLGYAAASIDASATRPVWAGVLDCCCLDRSLLSAVGGLDGPYLSPRLKSLDFALRLKAAGGQFHWAPAIALYALDEDERGDEPHWRRVRRLVDERSFAAKWGAALSAQINA